MWLACKGTAPVPPQSCARPPGRQLLVFGRAAAGPASRSPHRSSRPQLQSGARKSRYLLYRFAIEVAHLCPLYPHRGPAFLTIKHCACTSQNPCLERLHAGPFRSIHEVRWRPHLDLQTAESPGAPLFAVSSLAFLISMFPSSLWSPSEVSVATNNLSFRRPRMCRDKSQ